jgi:heparan-alpha-glucosaminide N-acetyltransferase
MIPPKQNRLASIDILRALTMLLMIFVNDLWSLTNIPAWLEHTQAAEDGMGLADTVFPAFLFITGMSIPLAVAHRRSKGDSNGQILTHILLRGIALLVMGVWLVNGESINEAATGMKRIIWNMICWGCFIILWNAWPEKANKKILTALKTVAVIVLIILAWIYRGSGHNDTITRFAQHWWGILGLIGWAYLVSAIIYTLSNNKVLIILIAWLVFNVLCIGSHDGWFSSMPFLKTILSPIGGGAMTALVTGGALTTMIFLQYRNKGENGKMFLTLFVFAVLLIAVGFYLRQFWGGISKIRATPSWVLICSGITIITFLIIYWIADLNSKAKWFDSIKPAGTNTLTCYMLPYYAYAIVVLFHLTLPATLLNGGIGLIKSFLFSLLMVVLAGMFGKWGLRLKL